MATTLSKRNRSLSSIDTLNIKGEEFVLMKKEYFKELTTLMNSFVEGEKLLKAKKTRSFGEFLDSLHRRK